MCESFTNFKDHICCHTFLKTSTTFFFCYNIIGMGDQFGRQVMQPLKPTFKKRYYKFANSYD